MSVERRYKHLGGIVCVSDRPTVYLDDCADDKLLESLLAHAGYTVVTPRMPGGEW